MPTPTYTPLAETTLASTAATVTFSSISQDFKDVILIIRAKATTGAGWYIRLNGNSSNIYSGVSMYGSGSGSGSAASETSATAINYNLGATYVTTSGIMSTIQLMDYSATNKHKTVLTRNGEASNGVDAYAHRFGSTSAVTSIAITINGDTFAAGSTFALYGIAA